MIFYATEFCFVAFYLYLCNRNLKTNNMKEITIQVPDDCEVKIVKKENKFKKGDIIVPKNSGLIAIYEKTDFTPNTNYKVVFYSTLYMPNRGFTSLDKIDFGIGTEEDCRKATSAERLILYTALYKEDRDNEKARKVLKEVFNKDYEPIIRTYQDLIDNNVQTKGFYINNASDIFHIRDITITDDSCRNVATSEKIAKSMLSMAMISQLMLYYGGEITDEEWEDGTIPKHIISRSNSCIKSDVVYLYYNFLAFHTAEQRDDFLKYNEQLVKDYLMID